MSGALIAMLATPSYRVTVSPEVVGGSGSGVTVTTDPVTVSVDPAGSYTYAWEKVSGAALVAVSSASATTAFRGSPTFGQVLAAVFRCAVSDGAVTIYSPNVSADVVGT